MSSSTTTNGIGFTGLLTIAFIVLKLVGVISWSWWWVLSPIWISFVIFMIFMLIFGIIFLIIHLIQIIKE